MIQNKEAIQAQIAREHARLRRAVEIHNLRRGIEKPPHRGDGRKAWVKWRDDQIEMLNAGLRALGADKIKGLAGRLLFGKRLSPTQFYRVWHNY